MPTAEDFKLELHRMMLEAVKNGEGSIEIRAGDLHRRVGEYPGKNHRMPICCKVMLDAFTPDGGDVMVQKPPSGQGASLTIRYALPSRLKLLGGA